ncbi:uncharacterized protein LOC130894455 [Diorhabda carinulata]|uniref:uncharacterized protein LOC130894455 n=1 Tax=Diorhabda carinulata TaxID=1163345 RepID=UPI0025A2C206|nr:uncharacterized protein LOC130894455 [Diorhabda carinulata]
MITHQILLLQICLAMVALGAPLIDSDVKSNTTSCCTISRCTEIPMSDENHDIFQCYKKEVCGEECTDYKKRPLPPVPQYQRKNYYVKKICNIYGCYDYAFDCRRCLDPKRGDFNPYNINENCMNCYY